MPKQGQVKVVDQTELNIIQVLCSRKYIYIIVGSSFSEFVNNDIVLPDFYSQMCSEPHANVRLSR